MTEPANIRRYRLVSINHIQDQVEEWGSGLYVVGMDNHTGFIVNEDGHCRFIHSYYWNVSRGVTSERLDSNNPLSASKYRVIGKVLTDDMVRKWLRNERFP